MRSAWKTEGVLLCRRWPELALLLLLSVCVGLYRTLGRGEATAIGMLTNQQFAFLPCWALAEVVFRDRRGSLAYRTALLSGHSRNEAFGAKLAVYLPLCLLLDALGCCTALLIGGCLTPSTLTLLLLRLWLDLGDSAVLLLTVQLPNINAPTRHILSGGCALALGTIGGMHLVSIAFSAALLIICPVLAWSVIRRCEL